MIEDYAFGRMRIKGKDYTSDLLIFPDGTVRDHWWRASGHRLTLADLADLLAVQPTVIVCGTGASGMMRPEEGLAATLAAKGVALLVHPTAKAATVFNRLVAEGRRPAACLHLTC